MLEYIQTINAVGEVETFAIKIILMQILDCALLVIPSTVDVVTHRRVGP